MDYTRVSDDDVIADAMQAAETLAQKKLLMRYKRLKLECLQRDNPWTGRVLNNYFLQIRKVGTLMKRGTGFFGSWQARFCVLSNMGLVYFKQDEMVKESDLEP